VGSLTITLLIFPLVLNTRERDATTLMAAAGLISTNSKTPVVTGGIGDFGVSEGLGESANAIALLPSMNPRAKQNPIPASFIFDIFIAILTRTALKSAYQQERERAWTPQVSAR
jgi:hypothetical protein